jgi:hypothetical protein
MSPQFDSDYKKRRYLERRGVDTEEMRGDELRRLDAGQAVRQQRERERQDRYLEQTGQLNYQQVQRPPQFLPPSTPSVTTPSLGAGGSSIQPTSGFIDPQTGQSLYSPGFQYTVNTENGLLTRQRNDTIWLNGNPAERNVTPPKPENMLGLATVQDALNGEANWTDIAVDQRKILLANKQFYETGQINNYPKWMQQQILADPNFKWENLPKWQKMYYELSSSPTGMGAVQGGLMGAFGGLGGAAVGGGLGAGLGYFAAKSGYDPTKEFWQQGNKTAGAFGFMNWLAEQAEKTVGLGVQSVGALADDDPNTQLKDVFTREGWDAGAVTFETVTPAMVAAFKRDGKFQMRDLLRIVPSTYFVTQMTDLMLNPEKYKGDELILGSNIPLELDATFQERINEARERIKKGENYREVALDFQNGVMGQLGDMAGQALADPLNVLPSVAAKGAGKIAEATVHTVAAQAIKLGESPVKAAQMYRNLVQTGEALKINPEFKVDQMGALARMVAGVNEQGQIKAGPFSKAGLLDAPAASRKMGFVEEMTSLTPQSRAQIGAGMFYENIGALLTRFDDPHEAGKYLKALSNNDMETWKELGSQFADSPEFYTILPALKDFNGKGLDGIIAAWDASQTNRDMLTRMADVLGENPSKLLEDLSARGTAEEDFVRTQQRLQQSADPNAKVLLGEIEAGRFTADTLKQIVDVFTGDGALAWHPGQAKALMLDALGSHFDEWVSKRLMLDQTPEAKSAFFRTAALMKTAQSVLLLGGSPGYAITNGLSNMVHRAATGVYGYLSPKSINTWMDRLGVSPARLEEGVGIGGIVEQANVKTGVKTEAVTKAVKGKGALTDAKEKVGNLARKMPFSKLSSWFEKNESRQAFAIGMKQFWNQSWRRGVGFKTMKPELVSAIRSLGIDPNHIYAAIEAGMNQTEIEKALYGRFEGAQSRSLIEEAAKKTGLSSAQAAEMLDKVGVLDTLDSFLKGQTTRDGVNAAFQRAERVAQDWMDMQAGEDLIAQAEHVKQRVSIEQPSAAFEVIQKANSTFTDTWMDHYFRFGDVMSDLTLLDDPAMKSKAIDSAYEISDLEFRRTNARNAANYKGIFDAWGKSGHPDALSALQAFGEMDTAMKQAYDFMRQSRREFFDKYRGDMNNPARWDDWEKSQTSIEQAFKRAFKEKHDAEARAGKALGNIFESLYGKAAGEAARQWWDETVKFNDETVARERTARAEFANLPKEQREAAKQKYYQDEKIVRIAESLKINEAGIARLERVVKGGGGSGLDTAAPTGPSGPSPVTSDQLSVGGEGAPTRPATADVNELMAQAEQRQAAEVAEQAQKVKAVWDVAEEYARVGLPYDRTILQDRFALIGALRKEEYGGIPGLTGLNDPRLTPELVREVMENRLRAKETEVQQKFGNAIARAEDAANAVRAPKINENTTILRAVSEHGGINLELAKDLTGEKRPKTAPGVFTKKGIGIDEMARMLADDGYPIDLNAIDDLGGIEQTRLLLERARRGDKVYPIGHDYEAMLARAQEEAAVKAFGEEISDQLAVISEPFDAVLWQRGLNEAAASGDLTGLYERIGELPEELSDQLSVNGVETWNDYVSRVADEVAARVETEARDASIAESMARADDALLAGETRAEYAETRNLLKEKFTEAFDLTDEQASAWMELSDAVAGWYELYTGENGEAFYNRYYADVVKSDVSSVIGGDALEQQLEPVNRRMTAEEVEGYARALVREGSMELRRAVKNENVKADRIAILDAAYKLNPEMAKDVAQQTRDVLFQNGKFETAKGVVTFDAGGIKATIHAFEAKDLSTLVHENAHVFRRMLSDVAARMGDDSPLGTRVKRDLLAIEEWAGVKDGKWSREAEETFARGFEKYLADGKAPTPKLRAAFESFKQWMLAVYKQITGSAIDVKLTPAVREAFDNMLDAAPDSVRDPYAYRRDRARGVELEQRLAEIRKRDTSQVSSLFQDADLPVGALDSASQFMPQSQVMEEGWARHIKPLLEAMEEEAVARTLTPSLSLKGEGGFKDMSAEGQAMLRQYMNGVKNDMATSKLAAMRWGEQKRDFAMLNYNKRYGFDRWLDVVYPYQFFYSRSMMTWAARALDTPAWFSNYARLRMQQQRYERDIPERLRNKIKIPAPWLPDWAGDALYIDPLSSLFPPANFMRPFERMQQDKTQQEMEAERILQEWANDGTVSQAAIAEAAQTRSGSAWERALAEAQIRRESEIANPMDFFSTMFGPAWYLSTPLNLAGIKAPGLSKGDPNKVNPTPLLNTARALDTVTEGTWAEPVGDVLGLLGKPEEWARKKAGLPTLGEYGEYYTKRQIANMVAEGKITSEQAQMAMIEKQGALWDEATQRVQMELAMRVPTMGAIYAGLHDEEGKGTGFNAKGFTQAMLPTLFGSGLLPEGELEYRGLKQEWNEAWAKYDRGDTQAVTGFFEEHPEYEAYLAKGKDDDELMQSFLIGQIWDGYMALGPTNQKQARAEMGEEFATAFLNKETRSYESVPTETLIQWAQMMNKMAPSRYQSAVSGGQFVNTAQLSPEKKLDLYDPNVTRITDEFFSQRTENFGNYYELEQGYYALPKSQRGSYLLENPELKAYWDWKKDWFKAYPDLVPILKGQVFKRVDTTGWPPGLVDYVTMYAYGGERLPKGAWKALEQQWIMAGSPYGNVNTWLNSTVAPAMLYGN